MPGLLEPAQQQQLSGLLAGEENPKEATAQMVNLSYAARHSKIDPDALAQNWPALRDQFASAVAEKPQQGVSDSQLYSLISQRLEKQQGERTMLGKVQSALVQDAMSGATSYVPTLQRMHEEMAKDPSYDPKHEDQYLLAVKGAWGQIQPAAARIAPAAKMVADLFQAQSQGIKDRDQNQQAMQSIQQAHSNALAALGSLPPQERQMAVGAGAEMAGKAISAGQDAGKVPTVGTGESLARGMADTFTSFGRTLERGAAFLARDDAGPFQTEIARKEMAFAQRTDDRADISAQLEHAYEDVANPAKGGAVARAWYGFAKNLPQLAGMVFQPELGTTLVLGSMADQSASDLQRRGMSHDEAFVGGLVAAAPAAALMKLQGGVLSGESMPWLSKFMDAGIQKMVGGFAGKSLGAFATNAAVLNLSQAAQDALDPAVQAVAHKLDAAVPEVNWGHELKEIGASRVDTFLNLLPLAIVGAGVGAFRESPAMRAFTAQKEFLQAAGFSEAQLDGIAKAPDAATATQLVREAWAAKAGTVESRDQGMAAANTKMDEAAGKVLQPGEGVPVGDDPHGALARAETTAQLLADQREAEQSEAGMFHVEQSAKDGTAQASTPEKEFANALHTVQPERAADVGQAVADDQQLSREKMQQGFVTAPSLPPGISDWLGDARRAAGAALKEARANPEMGPFKTALNGLIGRMQRNTLDVRALVTQIRSLVPDRAAREGITNWIQADGDLATLRQRAAATKEPNLRRGYEAALKLSPEQVQVAQFVKSFYDAKFKELSAAGLVNEAKEHYVNQVWHREYVGGGDAAQFAAKLDQNFKFGKESTFGSYFEGEQADFRPVTKDISNLVGVYLSESNKVMATREFLKQLTSMEAPDSTKQMKRPLASPWGGATISESPEEGPSFIRPMQRSENTSDYKLVDHPAMRGWKWLGEANGAPVMMEGQLAVHPEIARFVNALIGRDRIRDWYNSQGSALANVAKFGLKAVDRMVGEAKGLIFSLSGYHQVQETVRAIGYRVNPFTGLPNLESKNALITRSTNAGLMLAADNAGMRDFMEGYGSHSIFEHIPVAGDVAAKYSHWFFESYLPRLKQKTWESVVDRNTELYADELSSGKMKQADVDYLSASQVNAAYGHLNYVDLGRSPTAKHLGRLVFLAPDFLESTARTVGQAAKSAVLNKAGLEQLHAIAFLGLTQWMAARVLNKTIDGDWHNEEPFGVVVGGRLWSIRSIPGDIFEAAARPRQFATGRLSPLVTGAWEVGSGKNYRGEQVSVTDSMRDIATNVIPMSLRPVAGGLLRVGAKAADMMGKEGAGGALDREARNVQGAANTSLWDQFITSQGLRISRLSDVNQAFHLGQQWGRENLPSEQKPDSAVYPVSEWQHLRYALEDGDMDQAQAELKALQRENPKMKEQGQLVRSFQASLFRPFCGSKKMEPLFEASLDEHGTAVVQKAVEARQKVWSQFLELDLGAQPPASARQE